MVLECLEHGVTVQTERGGNVYEGSLVWSFGVRTSVPAEGRGSDNNERLVIHEGLIK